MNKTLIKNAWVVNQGSVEKKDVLIENQYIKSVSPNVNHPADLVIDARGKHLLPGVIDDQVHFREPGLTHKADIASESRAAIAGGITTFIEQPNTKPETTTIEKLEEKFAIAAAKSYANYSFMFGGTNTNLNEILKLKKDQAAGIKLFLGSSTGNMLVDNPNSLREIFSNTQMRISVHCEDEQTIQKNLAAHIKKYGEDISIEKHPIIRSEQACFLSSSKAIQLAKETGARLHVFHLSTAKETSLFENKTPLKEKQITAEVCVHHLWFSDQDYSEKGTLIKWNPAIKKASDRAKLWEALKEGRIDVIATDHAPHTFVEKSQAYTKAPSGGPLVQHGLLAMLDCVQKGFISLPLLVEKMCHNPAILFDIKKRGYIKEGYFADLVLIDLDKKTTVNKADILYKCGWSPFEGETFNGAITHTFVNGYLVYQNGKISEKRNAQRLTFNR